MHFKFRHLDKLVGGFFIVSLVCLLLLLVVVARGQRWFQKYVPYHSYFEKAGGLNVGDKVLIKGMEAGRVASVKLSKDNQIAVKYKIYSQYADKVQEGTRSKVSIPVVGSASVVLQLPIEKKPVLKAKSLIPSSEDESADLEKLIENATNLVAKLNDPDGTFMMTLAHLEQSTAELETTMKGRGSVGKLMNDSELHNRLVKISKNLQDITDKLGEASPDMRDAVISARKNLEEAEKVITALQKSVFLRGHIEQYLGEERLLTGAEGGTK